MFVGAIVALVAATSSCSIGSSLVPNCPKPDSKIFVLAAQGVPSATLLPCVADMPSGWSFGGYQIHDGFVRYWLDSDRAGLHAVRVDLRATCQVGDAIEVSPDEVGARVYSAPTSLSPRYVADRFYVYPGGCTTYHYAFRSGAAATLSLEADQALSFIRRIVVVERVHDEFGLSLCGAGAPPCAG